MSTQRCMCGDSQCPSCGLAQGTLERKGLDRLQRKPDETDVARELMDAAVNTYDWLSDRHYKPSEIEDIARFLAQIAQIGRRRGQRGAFLWS